MSLLHTRSISSSSNSFKKQEGPGFSWDDVEDEDIFVPPNHEKLRRAKWWSEYDKKYKEWAANDPKTRGLDEYLIKYGLDAYLDELDRRYGLRRPRDKEPKPRPSEAELTRRRTGQRAFERKNAARTPAERVHMHASHKARAAMTPEQVLHLRNKPYINIPTVELGKKTSKSQLVTNIRELWSKHELVRVIVKQFDRSTIEDMYDGMARVEQLAGGYALWCEGSNVFLHRGLGSTQAGKSQAGTEQQQQPQHKQQHSAQQDKQHQGQHQARKGSDEDAGKQPRPEDRDDTSLLTPF